MKKIKQLKNEDFLKEIRAHTTLIKNGLNPLNSNFSLKELLQEFYTRFVITNSKFIEIFQKFKEKTISEKEFRNCYQELCDNILKEKQIEF